MNTELRVALFADIDGYNTVVPLVGKNLVVWVVAQPPVESASTTWVCPVIQQPLKTSDLVEKFVERLTALDIDVIISCSYSRKIPASVLSLARLDAVNVHGGLLPECRGANILNWVLIEGHHRTGITVHELTDGFDEGDILVRHEIDIHRTDDAVSLRERLSRLVPDLLESLIAQWENGIKPPRAPQDGSKARHYPRRSPDDGLFDWTWSDEAIFNLVRGLVHPWPGAHFYDNQGTKHNLRSYHTKDQIHQLRNQFDTTTLRSGSDL